MSKEDDMAAELAQARAELLTAKALLIECLRLLTEEQYYKLRAVAGNIDLEWLGRQ